MRRGNGRQPATSAPAPTSLHFSGKEFLPQQGDEQLRKAISFLAGAFAGSVDQLATALPELEVDLARVAREPSWAAAAKRAAELWSTRHVRGEVDDTRVAASIVFVGAGLVTVSAQGEHHTFRFDTRDFDRAAAVSVSGFFLTPAATRKATRLRAGETIWHFDPGGTLTHVTR